MEIVKLEKDRFMVSEKFCNRVSSIRIEKDKKFVLKNDHGIDISDERIKFLIDEMDICKNKIKKYAEAVNDKYFEYTRRNKIAKDKDFYEPLFNTYKSFLNDLLLAEAIKKNYHSCRYSKFISFNTTYRQFISEELLCLNTQHLSDEDYLYKYFYRLDFYKINFHEKGEPRAFYQVPKEFETITDAEYFINDNFDIRVFKNLEY